MASYPLRRKFTEQEYLTVERAAEFKSEFLDGEMYAMSGASDRHGDLQSNLIFELRFAMRDRRCKVYASDNRIRVSERAYLYPDVSVFCGPVQTTDQHRDNLINPVVVFEILSPSTEKYDRDVKFRYYGEVNSLVDYILVSQDQMRIEQFTREPGGSWRLRDHHKPEEELKIESIGVAIPLVRIYEGVELGA